MKPNFALTLSFDSISLLHRAFPGWHLVGEVSLESTNLGAALSKLHDKAQALGPSDPRCKLVIPNNQIKYLEFDAEGLSEAGIDKAVRDALDGATPYPIEDLAIDWSLGAGLVQIAAVARNTLTEAEHFANQHGFKPVSCVAIPETGQFVGEPYFGETGCATNLLEQGDSVEHDSTPIRVLSTTHIPEHGLKPEGHAAPPIEEAPPEPPTSFTSVRAVDHDAPTPSAPVLTGVNRHMDLPSSNIQLQVEAPVHNAQKAKSPAKALKAQSHIVSAETTPTPKENKPRHLALILVCLLLVFLAGVAAWASIFLDDGIARLFRGQDNPLTELSQTTAQSDAPSPIAAKPPVTLSEEAQDTSDKTSDQAVRDIINPSLSNNEPGSKQTEDVAKTPPDIEETVSTQDHQPTAPSHPVTVNPDEARARYAATGIWQIAPRSSRAPRETVLKEFHLTALDPNIQTTDATTLPSLNAVITDFHLQTPVSPPSAGTSIALDASGYIAATPEGTLIPEGIRIYTGRPALIPPLRPQTTLETSKELSTVSADEVANNNSAAFRPKLRPADLIEQVENNNLSVNTRTELAALRPRLRPEKSPESKSKNGSDIAEIALIQTDPDTVAAVIKEAVEAETELLASATSQAVRVSTKPNLRPNNFDQTIKQDQEKQATTAVNQSQRVTPQFPSSVSVARQATETNILKLRKVNLIGVYGAPNNRRALVRLANGRYKKVEVGDRLDGGDVAAISANELRYIKRGKNLILQMPKG